MSKAGISILVSAVSSIVFFAANWILTGILMALITLISLACAYTGERPLRTIGIGFDKISGDRNDPLANNRRARWINAFCAVWWLFFLFLWSPAYGPPMYEDVIQGARNWFYTNVSKPIYYDSVYKFKKLRHGQIEADKWRVSLSAKWRMVEQKRLADIAARGAWTTFFILWVLLILSSVFAFLYWIYSKREEVFVHVSELFSNRAQATSGSAQSFWQNMADMTTWAMFVQQTLHGRRTRNP
jgi:ABC-type multidrug transport system fused ATPase/permease subunit